LWRVLIYNFNVNNFTCTCHVESRKKKQFSATVKQTDQLLDIWIEILSQSIHTQKILYDSVMILRLVKWFIMLLIKQLIKNSPQLVTRKISVLYFYITAAAWFFSLKKKKNKYISLPTLICYRMCNLVFETLMMLLSLFSRFLFLGLFFAVNVWPETGFLNSFFNNRIY